MHHESVHSSDQAIYVTQPLFNVLVYGWNPLSLIHTLSCLTIRWVAEEQIAKASMEREGRILRQARGVLYDVPGEGILGEGDTCGVSLLGAGQRLKVLTR